MDSPAVCICGHAITEKVITARGFQKCVAGCKCKSYRPMMIAGLPVKQWSPKKVID